jgi:hypothetical protein
MTGTDTTHLIDDLTSATNLLAELARDNDWVSVFWDRGWGDAPLDISIVVDGNGQAPTARITPAVYSALLDAGTIRGNSLRTRKARRLHDYCSRHPFVDDGSDYCQSCTQHRDHPDHSRHEPVPYVEPDMLVANRLAVPLLIKALESVETHDVPVLYAPDLDHSRPLTVLMSPMALEFHVNAFGPPVQYFGADVLPVGKGNLGEDVSFGGRPGEPGWEEQILPRLVETLQRAVDVVRAHRDGTVCGSKWAGMNGGTEIIRHCKRSAGHVEDHTDTHQSWTDTEETQP